MLGKKQVSSKSDLMYIINNISDIVPKSQIDSLIDKTVKEVIEVTKNKRCAFAWSGGKDSQALQAICKLAGIDDCMLAITNLEYPEFLRWVTDNMPWKLEIINTKQDIDWLKENTHMLFPKNSVIAAKWFKIVQHKAQDIYFKKSKLDLIILGRRKIDGNYTGKKGSNIYTNKLGITRYSPLKDWSHEDVIASCYYYNYPLPPVYNWPNGFAVGTGPWPSRQYTKTIQNGWGEVYQIDSDIVKFCQSHFASAKVFMDSL